MFQWFMHCKILTVALAACHRDRSISVRKAVHKKTKKEFKIKMVEITPQLKLKWDIVQSKFNVLQQVCLTQSHESGNSFVVWLLVASSWPVGPHLCVWVY
jgi:hypothetical protein